MFRDFQENMNIVTHENMTDNQIFGAKKHNIHNVKKNCMRWKNYKSIVWKAQWKAGKLKEKYNKGYYETAESNW